MWDEPHGNLLQARLRAVWRRVGPDNGTPVGVTLSRMPCDAGQWGLKLDKATMELLHIREGTPAADVGHRLQSCLGMVLTSGPGSHLYMPLVFVHIGVVVALCACVRDWLSPHPDCTLFKFTALAL